LALLLLGLGATVAAQGVLGEAGAASLLLLLVRIFGSGVAAADAALLLLLPAECCLRCGRCNALLLHLPSLRPFTYAAASNTSCTCSTGVLLSDAWLLLLLVSSSPAFETL
jgi:hypothetical protein